MLKTGALSHFFQDVFRGGESATTGYKTSFDRETLQQRVNLVKLSTARADADSRIGSGREMK